METIWGGGRDKLKLKPTGKGQKGKNGLNGAETAAKQHVGVFQFRASLLRPASGRRKKRLIILQFLSVGTGKYAK